MDRAEKNVVFHCLNNPDLLKQLPGATESTKKYLRVLFKLYKKMGGMDKTVFNKFITNSLRDDPYINEILDVLTWDKSHPEYMEFDTAIFLFKKKIVREEIMNMDQRLYDIESEDDLLSNVNDLLETISKTIDKKAVSLLRAVDQDSTSEESVTIDIPNLEKKVSMKYGYIVTIGGAPGTGKTAVICSLIPRIINLNKDAAVMFLSLEMSAKRISDRMISAVMDMEVNYTASIRVTNKSEYMRLLKAIDPQERLWFIHDNISNSELFALCKHFLADCNKRKLKPVIILDHIGEIGSTKYEDRKKSKETTMAILKSFAREGALCINLVQYTKEVNSLNNKNNMYKPSNAFIRDTQEIEAKSDVIIHLWRPEMYGFDEYNGDSTSNIIYFIIGKNRDGMMGEIPIGINMAKSAIIDGVKRYDLYKVVSEREKALRSGNKYDFDSAEKQKLVSVN